MQKITITIRDKKIEAVITQLQKHADILTQAVNAVLDEKPDVMIDVVQSAPDDAMCQSTNHRPPHDCYGDIWECMGCGRTFCQMEGSDDQYPGLCDSCYVIVADADMGFEPTGTQKEYMDKYGIKDIDWLREMGQ